jgi:hypothetical protein
MGPSLRGRCRGYPRCANLAWPLKNRIQECHQFGRSQDSSHSNPARTPGLDDRSPGELPAAVSAAGMPPGVLPALTRHPRLEMLQLLARLEMLARRDVVP